MLGKLHKLVAIVILSCKECMMLFIGGCVLDSGLLVAQFSGIVMA